MKERVLILLGMFVVLVGCNRTKPQAPTRGAEPDTLLQTMIGIHQRLALEADEELAHYAAAHEGFVRDSTGIWMQVVLRNPQGDTLAEQYPVQIDYIMKTLDDSTQLGEGHKVVTLGKKEVPAALETAMRMMRDGEEAEVLAPWYQMYGREGKGKVEPYEQVLVRLKVELVKQK